MANLLFDALFAPLQARQSRFLWLEDGRSITGAEFFRSLAQMAQALKASGVRPGDRVAVQIAKSPEALATYAAVTAIGAVFLPLNTGYTPDELDYFLGNATPALFLCDPSRAGALTAIAARHGANLLTLDAAGQGSFADLAAIQPAEITPTPRAAADLAAILYTSGTTGRSKGAMLTPRQPAVERPHAGRALALHRRRRAAARPADLPHPRPVRRLQHCPADRRHDDLPARISTPATVLRADAAGHGADGRADLLHPAAGRARA